MSEIRDIVWRAGKLLADEVDTEEAFTEVFDRTADDETLWEAHAVSTGGSKAMTTIGKEVIGRWQTHLASRGAEAIRMGDTLYRIKKNGRWIADVAALVQFLVANHPDEAPEILAAAFPAYSVRTTRLIDTAGNLLGESTGQALKDTFCQWSVGNDSGRLRPYRIGERGTPQWAAGLAHGELKEGQT